MEPNLCNNIWKYDIVPLKMFLDSALNINRTNIVHRMYILGNRCAVLQKTSGKSLHFVNPTLQP